MIGLPDGGKRQTYNTGAQREPQTPDKGRFDLLPPEAIRRLAIHYAMGSLKYSSRNWEKGLPLSRFIDSGLRHVFAYMAGDRTEDHMAAALWNFAGFIETQERIARCQLPQELNDLPPSSGG